MRLTIVSETYLPQLNGVSRTLGQLVRVLEEQGDAVQLIHPDYGEPRRHADDVLVRSEEIPFYREVRLPMPPFSSVRHAIDRFRPDLIHIATEATLGLSVLQFARRRRIPVVSSFHTNFDQYTDHYRFGWLNGAVWRYLRWFHNQTRETYVPSRATIETLRARGFERLALWPRGVDCDQFRPDAAGRARVRERLGMGAEQVVVGHVSRIAAEKNVEYLAAALERLVSGCARARVIVVGDGPARAELEARLGAAGTCVGYQTGAALAEYYAAFDLFAFASTTETFGNVVLEAMAAGLPVVALDAGGPGEIVRHQETGILISPKSAASVMADALAGLIQDEARRAAMGAAARKYAEGQSWRAIMLGLRARYEGVMRS